MFLLFTGGSRATFTDFLALSLAQAWLPEATLSHLVDLSDLVIVVRSWDTCLYIRFNDCGAAVSSLDRRKETVRSGRRSFEKNACVLKLLG